MLVQQSTGFGSCISKLPHGGPLRERSLSIRRSAADVSLMFLDDWDTDWSELCLSLANSMERADSAVADGALRLGKSPGHDDEPPT